MMPGESVDMKYVFFGSLATLVLFVAAPAAAEAPATLWTQTFGGSDWDSGESVEQTADGSFVQLGYTKSFGAGNYDFWLIKTDADGKEIWSRTFGGSGYDRGYSLEKTADGGFILLGETQSYGAGSADFWLIKTDSEGNEIWNQTFGGTEIDKGYSVQQTTDGGYVLLGDTKSFGTGYDLWVIRVDGDGNELWSKAFGGSEDDRGRSVQETTGGGFALLGETKSYGSGTSNFWLIKIDSAGTKLWDKTFAGTGFCVEETSDGGLILLGSRRDDICLIKTDGWGIEVWTKIFGGSDPDHGYSVQETSKGGYILLGDTVSYGAGSTDLWLIETDAAGNELWNKTFGGTDTDFSSSVRQTEDGGFILVGKTSSFGAGDRDSWLIRLEGEEAPIVRPAISFPSLMVDQAMSDVTFLFMGEGAYSTSSVVFDGRDVSNFVARVGIRGGLEDGGEYIRIPSLPAAKLGLGVHVLMFTIDDASETLTITVVDGTE